MARPRGRPREYDPDAALDAALEVFWTKGYAATSLDDLRRATGMNRPSLYAAFGNKKAIYRRSLDRFRDRMWRELKPVVEDAPDLLSRLVGYYRAVLAHYVSAGGATTGDPSTPPAHGRGCMAFSTAAVQAAVDPDVRADLAGILADTDRMFARWFRRAQGQGSLPDDVDPVQLAWLAAAVQHSLSLRARAGRSRRSLEAMARTAASMVLRAAGGRAGDAGTPG